MRKHFLSVISALFVSIALLVSCVSAAQAPSGISGTFTGSSKGHGGELSVELTLKDGKIVQIAVTRSNETAGIGEAAIDTIPGRIVADQSLAVDVVTGATEASNAIIDAVADALKKAGADEAAYRRKAGKAASARIDEEISCDVVVVGAGAAGSAAALSALEGGAKVVLLEKTSIPAGAGTFAGGMFANGTKAQKAAGQADASKWLFDRYMESSGFHADARLVRVIIAASGQTNDWLNENGARFTPVDPGAGGAVSHRGDPKVFMGYVDGGSAAIGALIAKIREKGGIVRFDSPATDLLKDSAGRVNGVLAKTKDGGTVTVKAGSVILATGGFGGNRKMMVETFGEKIVPGFSASSTGDGLRMAWSAGAAKHGTALAHFFAANPATKEITGPIMNNFMVMTTFPLLWVNKLGQRFCNEEVVFNFAYMGNVLFDQPDATAWMIFDQSFIERVKTDGIASIVDVYGSWKGNPQRFMEFNMPMDTDISYQMAKAPYDLTPFLLEGEKAGFIVRSGTLEDLGSAAGIESETYRKTIASYAAMTRVGVDEQFFKKSEYLFPLRKGPYYALRMTTRCLSTLGGVKIDADIRAVDENGHPIPGLWVAGADAGGMYGSSYVQAEGGTLGFAYTSGRIAGQKAAEYALRK